MRVVIRKPFHLGLWGGLTISGHDMYATRVGGGVIKGPDGQHRPLPIFSTRDSYHASGQQHSYDWITGIDETRTRTEPVQSPPPTDLVGAKFMSSQAYASHTVQAGFYQVKNKRPYVNLIVDYSTVRHYPSFALDFWCIGDDSPPIEELYGDAKLLRSYCLRRGSTRLDPPRIVDLVHCKPKLLRTAQVDWTRPRLAAVVWTLPARAWWGWASSTGRAIPEPGEVAISRDKEGEVHAVHHESGKPPLDELGPIFKTSLGPTDD